jgi:hypothetical protein
MPLRNIDRLQRVQNALARVTSADYSTKPLNLLRSLHWLPVQQRISFKLCTLVYRSLHGSAPHYLSSLLDHYTPSRQLRSSDQNLLTQPRVNTTIATRGFRSCGPRLWNSLPDTVKSSETVSTFRSQLKSHFFSNAFRNSGP